MKSFKAFLPSLLLGILLAGCIVAAFLTRGTNATEALNQPAANHSPIDERLHQTARRLVSIADSPEEQALAREAIRLADLQTDQAFAGALREAAATSLKPASGPLQQIVVSIARLRSQIAAGEERIAKLTKPAETDDAAADQLEVAKAQLALNQDELADAQQDLARKGGDPGAAVERAFQEYQAVRKQPLPPMPAAAQTSNMSQQIRAWFSLHDRAQQVSAAREQAAAKAVALERRHDALEKIVESKPNSKAPQAESNSNQSEPDLADDSPRMIARLRHLSNQRKSLTELDKRIAVTKQLATVYENWSTIVASRKTLIAHLLLISLAIIVAILLALEIISRIVRGFIAHQSDRRRLHQLRALNTIAVQVTGAILILLVVFGIPTETSTMIGLATAGLTVALKDFIVAFFGWFALMGRNGIRIGDWVEIEGVGGEVVEIGVIKTVLLEMGNWTNTGHPTGRRVSFVNKFAIENHYFNFSTAGQWLWDELKVTLPPTGDPYAIAMQIRDIVDRETASDSAKAQQDWERVTNQYGTRPFSAKPAIDLKPAVNGLEVTVRYITRAPERYDVRSRLFEAIVAVIRQNPAPSQIAAP
jgi:small-conductance mechanosensitive channel